MSSETSTVDRRGDGPASVPSAGPVGGSRAARGERAGRGRRIVVLVVLTALSGAALGLALALTHPPRPVATVRFAVLADPVLPGDSTQGSSTTDHDRFVQTQLLVLGGVDLRHEVARQLRTSPVPDVEAVQVGATDVVQVSVTGATPRAATQAAGRLLRVYAQQRDTAFASRAGALDTALDQQLRTVHTSLQGTAPGKGSTDPAGLQASAATEYARLLAASNDLGLVSAADRTFTTLVQSPAAQPVRPLVVAVRDAALGLLAGLVLAVAAAVLPRWARSV